MIRRAAALLVLALAGCASLGEVSDRGEAVTITARSMASHTVKVYAVDGMSRSRLGEVEVGAPVKLRSATIRGDHIILELDPVGGSPVRLDPIHVWPGAEVELRVMRILAHSDWRVR